MTGRAEERYGVCGQCRCDNLNCCCTEGEGVTSILVEAELLATGERQANYGHPLDNHTATGEMWAVYLERKYGVRLPIDADDVCWMNAFQKGVRDAHVPQRDNLIDTAGYVRNIELVRDERAQRDPTS